MTLRVPAASQRTNWHSGFKTKLNADSSRKTVTDRYYKNVL